MIFEIMTIRIDEEYQINLVSLSEQEMLIMEKSLELLKNFTKIKPKVKKECEIITLHRE
jgi:hypothetical protein